MAHRHDVNSPCKLDAVSVAETENDPEMIEIYQKSISSIKRLLGSPMNMNN
jgi:hypothetical protein